MLPSPPAEMDYRPTSKRKRSDIEAQEKRDHSFQLQNLATSSCLSFESLSRLLRAHLPLSWIAPTTSNELLPAGTLLQGSIKHVTVWDYSVQIVRQLPNGGLFALEKVDEDCFVAFALQPFVTERWIQDATIGAAPTVNMQMMLHYIPVSEPIYSKASRRTPSLSSEAAIKLPKNRKGMAARLSILSQNENQESPVASPTLQDIPDTCTSMIESRSLDEVAPLSSVDKTITEENAAVITQSLSTEAVPQTDMLTAAHLRQRYLETLYKAKTPITFYAKGALSRARARARAPNASMTLKDLAAFYRDSVLPVKKWDLKYRESLRNAINEAIRNSDVDSSMQKKKPTRKTKLGKDGLWPTEAEYIAHWWTSRTLTSVAQGSHEAELRTAIDSLLFREMQMQIVIILETLAIESKQTSIPQRENDEVEKPNIDDSCVKIESIESDAVPAHESKKSVKRRKLEEDLQHLTNKLCIRHTIEVESIGSSTFSIKNSKAEDAEGEPKDRLRSFCTDVVVPFYGSKLPRLCEGICESLAGRGVFEQIHKAASVQQNLSQPLVPGAAIKRQPTSRGDNIERVLSGNLHRQSPPSVVARPSTLPPVPTFRRQASETSQRPLSRQNSISFTNREVDLVADAKVTASKRRKLESATAQRELKAAIQNLKKPNRQAAGKAHMDELERRRLIVDKPALVTATPRANRRKTLNDIGEDNRGLRTSFDEEMIPSSGMKSRPVPTLASAPASSSRKRAVLAAIHDTPSRGAAKRSDPLQLLDKPTAIPVQNNVPGQGHVSTSSASARSSSFATSFSTPIKRRTTSQGQENSFQLSDLAVRTMDRAMNMPIADSIYDELGWNEDDEV